MATRSTASSSTDPVAAGPGSEPVDLGRRSFFRNFGRSALLTAGQVAGAAEAVRRKTSAVASDLLDPADALAPAQPVDRVVSIDASDKVGPSSGGSVPAPRAASYGAPRSDAAFSRAAYRSPYRLDGDTLFLLDQRGLPERLDSMACRDGREVARAIRLGAVRGGASLAQVAAYGVALSAHRHRERRPIALRGEIDADMSSLRSARPSAHALKAALDRLRARLAALPPDADPEALAHALRAEADAIASEAMLDHAALAGHGAAWLPIPAGRSLQLLLHGGSGPMAGGVVGTGMAIIQRLVAEARPVHAWVTEGRPTGEGARITTWELRHAGVPHTVVPDPAVGWLLQHQRPDAVLLSAEWLSANGDAAVFAGGGAIAALAAGRSAERVPVLLCAPATSFDPATLDGAAIPDDLRTGREAGSLIHPGTPPGTQVITPAVDIARAEHLAAIATRAGVVGPPFIQSLSLTMTAPAAG